MRFPSSYDGRTLSAAALCEARTFLPRDMRRADERLFLRGNKKISSKLKANSWELKNGGGRIRTCGLEVMSLASYRAAPPRDKGNKQFAIRNA